jgi:ubiquinone/menaquinone biosynthesis C-methylase UbiE
MSDSYARWRASRLGRITDALEQRLLFDLLGPIAGKNVLDVGCGDDAIASELALRGAAVTGLDPDPVIIAAARRRAAAERIELRLVEGKAESLPFSDATFDAVLAVATLCFIRDAERAIAEMARALKPGGRIVIGELGRWSLWAAYRRFRGWFGHPTWQAARFRSETELRRLLAAGGFDVVETRGAIFYPPCGIAARLFAAIDSWLGRRTSLGAAFIAIAAAKPAETPEAARLQKEREIDTPPTDHHRNGAASTISGPESPLREMRRQKGLSFYERWILPPLLDLVMRQEQLEKYRREAVAPARGRVLEIGIGSGLNFPHYGEQVEAIIGLEPSPELLVMARRRAAEASVRADFIQGSATAIPVGDSTIDTIVMTWTLCSISDPSLALREMRRVLKADGRLLFIEHGLCPAKSVERWQHRLTPIWRHVSGGCCLDRRMDDLIRSAGFELTELKNEYAEGPRIFTYMYQGCARPSV